MKNVHYWRPSKYTYEDGRLSPSKDAEELHPSSRLIAHLISQAYTTAIAKYARGHLLDLGCGKVPFYQAYESIVSNSTCVDWPNSAHGSMHVDTFCDLTQRLPFDDSSFDTIISSDVIEHLPNPFLAFEEISRLLKPGGALLLNTPFLYMLHEVPHDHYRFTRYALSKLTLDSGLRILELKELGGIADAWSDLTAKALFPLPVAGEAICSGLQALAIACSRTSIWKKITEKSAGRFPLGYFLAASKP